MNQEFVLVLGVLALAMLSDHLRLSVAFYWKNRKDRRRADASSRLIALVSAFMLWSLVMSVVVGRLIATTVSDPVLRSDLGLASGSVVSGVILLGGAWIVILWRD